MAQLRGREAVVRYLAARVLWGTVIIWLVLSVTWLLVRIKQAAGTTQSGRQGPLLEPDLLTQYLEWLWNYLVLQWGPNVVETWTSAAPVTLAYLVPSLLIAALVGVGLASYGAIHPGGWIDRFVSALSYAGVSIPVFVLAEGFLVLGVKQFNIYTIFRPQQPLLALENVIGLSIPTGLLTLWLIGVMARYTRNESVSHLNKEFMKTARAKGASRLRLAAHVLRNAWLAVAQVMVSETMGLIFLGIIVLESALSIPGIGQAVFQAFQDADGPLIISVVLVAAVVGVLGTLLQDVGRIFLMPDSLE